MEMFIPIKYSPLTHPVKNKILMVYLNYMTPKTSGRS